MLILLLALKSKTFLNAILKNSGDFYDAVKQYVASQTTTQDPSSDYGYNDVSFADLYMSKMN